MTSFNEHSCIPCTASPELHFASSHVLLRGQQPPLPRGLVWGSSAKGAAGRRARHHLDARVGAAHPPVVSTATRCCSQTPFPRSTPNSMLRESTFPPQSHKKERRFSPPFPWLSPETNSLITLLTTSSPKSEPLGQKRGKKKKKKGKKRQLFS